jgi:hypothetical protein
VVDGAEAAGRLSLQMDGQDLGRIAYPGPEGLRYAQQTPSGWLTETVTVGQPDYISLVLDDLDRPHIAWYDVGQSALKYAAYIGASWQVMTVDNSGNVGQYASLALDEYGLAHISYYDSANSDLKYARQSGNLWHVTTLVSDGEVGSDSTLMLLDRLRVYIAYLDSNLRELKIIYSEFDLTEEVFLPAILKTLG